MAGLICKILLTPLCLNVDYSTLIRTKYQIMGVSVTSYLYLVTQIYFDR